MVRSPLLSLVVVSACASAEPPLRYEVTSLPGLEGHLPSRMFTGHLPAGLPPSGQGSMYFHYWLVESEGNVKEDPVLIWYNGGPGASSLFGLLQELGPLLLNDDSYDAAWNATGVPSPQRNAFSWSKSATVVAIDSPAPTGFSYCDPPGVQGDGYACGPWNDSSVADANYLAITGLLNDAFPELRSNELFLVGESYAGVYVPMFVDRLLDNPRGLNLAGFAVGDGCIGNEVLCGTVTHYKEGPWYKLEFLHGHGQFSNELYTAIRTQCPEIDLRKGNMTSKCKSLVDEVDDEVGGFFGYSLYDDCIYSEPFLASANGDDGRGAMNGYPCPGTAMRKWLDRTDVKQAIGVHKDAVFFDADNGDGMTYVSTEPDVRRIYARAIQAGLRTLVYNGDTDPGINTLVTQDHFVSWAAQTGLQRTQRWRPWTLDGRQRVGGYVMEWEDGKFSYLTIRGAGHMVPEYKPAAALTMIQRFMSGQDYPRYVKPADERRSRFIV